MTAPAADIVREFWSRMASNDFLSVAPLLTGDFFADWPQSNERIRGATNFARLNAEYPAHGPWRFEIVRILGEGTEAVSDVKITDGVSQARAISFFVIEDGKIAKITEFWPEPYSPPPNRRHLVEPIEPVQTARVSS